MGNTIGYMVTLRMYGSWLQGDERGYVKDGERFGRDDALHDANKNNLAGRVVGLSDEQKILVNDAILAAGRLAGEKIEAIAVCSDHVHVVVRDTGRNISDFVGRSKAAGRMVLRDTGIVGKMWAKDFDRRFCFDEESFRARIDYVKRQSGGDGEE